jgi:hypothetical protein
LSKYAYYELLLQLLRCNYRYITVNAGLLIYCGQKDGYRGGGDFALALEELGRAETTLDSMVFVAAESLAHVWTVPMLSMMKSLITRRVLRIVTANHPTDETLKLLLAHLFARLDGAHYSQVHIQVTQFVASNSSNQDDNHES